MGHQPADVFHGKAVLELLIGLLLHIPPQHVQQMARAIGTDLSMGEIMDALAAGGATQASMVAQPQEICEQELHQLVSAAERLTSLGSGMRSAAGNFEATDSKISQMIGE